MAKFKKIAAIAAAAVITVSAMAISVSAATLRDSVNQSTSYGTYQGVLTFQPYGTGRMGTTSTTMLNGVAVDHITAGIGVWNLKHRRCSLHSYEHDKRQCRSCFVYCNIRN